MHTHAPPDYACPFCAVAQGIERDGVLTRQADIVARTGETTAFICSHQFAANPGHVLIIPNAHWENVYQLPVALLSAVHAQVQIIARAMKTAYRCDGVTVWQSNEPAGTQTVWHYHVHVIPRFAGDGYFQNLADLELAYLELEPSRRAELARQLCAELIRE